MPLLQRKTKMMMLNQNLNQVKPRSLAEVGAVDVIAAVAPDEAAARLRNPDNRSRALIGPEVEAEAVVAEVVSVEAGQDVEAEQDELVIMVNAWSVVMTI